MQKLLYWFHQLYNVQWVVETFGYSGLATIIFVETGLFVGFFLPGDSMLFTAGLACVKDNAMHVNLDLLTLNLWLIPAAIIGDTVGFWIGRACGPALYHREKTFFFRKDHLLMTRAFYEKHGGKTIVLARFVPIVRTFAPAVAGVAQMDYRRFFAYNIVGGIGWVTGLSLLGYYLGGIELIKSHVEGAILLIILISLLPAVIMYLTGKRDARLASMAENKQA